MYTNWDFHMTHHTLAAWRRKISGNAERALTLLQQLRDSLSLDDNAWITLASSQQLQSQWQTLQQRAASQENLPLFGIPFAVKDNIDVAGWATTAACPAFAYVSKRDATAVAHLKAAGAIVIGKTNLDQFATGLVGTRSPFGAVANTFNPRYVSGGSSAGSASVVARGIVPFALGTDTAGSGRVPASFNNIVGLKPTKGWLSNSGVVPACRLNDTLSVFALTVEDAYQIATLAGQFDPDDAYSRRHPASAPAALPEHPTLAIPQHVTFVGDPLAETAWRQALDQLRKSGATLVPIDFSNFSQLAEQLYQGPWVAERTAAVGDQLSHPEQMDPTVYQIIASGTGYSAVEAYRAEYLRAELARRIQHQLAQVDALVVPTTPTIRTQAEIEQEPLRYNSEFGTYTNFTNLADLSALALPAPFRADGLPAGITLIAPAWHDRALASFGRRWQHQLALPLGATKSPLPSEMSLFIPSSEHLRIAVVGAHLRGMPLNAQLTTRHAVFVSATRTAPRYRLYALADAQPAKPGLVRHAEGTAIDVELWDIPLAEVGSFMAQIPAPLSIGTIELSDGQRVKGFLCETIALESAQDISRYGGWREWLAQEENAHV